MKDEEKIREKEQAVSGVASRPFMYRWPIKGIF